MANESSPIDVSSLPELAHLVDEVRRGHRPRVLRRADEDVAILTPLPQAGRRRSSGRVLREDDGLFGLIGIGDSGIPGGVSGKKNEALGRLRHT